MLINNILELIFPSKCIWCKAYGWHICDKCELKLIRNRSKIKIPWIKEVFVPYRYSDNRLLEWCFANIKYSGKYAKCEFIAKKMAIEVDKHLGAKYLILVPVPLHPERKKKRWFNQAEKIADIVMQKLKNHNAIVLNLLERIRNTDFQSGKTKNERSENVKWAFIALKRNIWEATIVLVDDILTTWSTLHECARELKKLYKWDIYAIAWASDHG